MGGSIGRVKPLAVACLLHDGPRTGGSMGRVSPTGGLPLLLLLLGCGVASSAATIGGSMGSVRPPVPVARAPVLLETPLLLPLAAAAGITAAATAVGNSIGSVKGPAIAC